MSENLNLTVSIDPDYVREHGSLYNGSVREFFEFLAVGNPHPLELVLEGVDGAPTVLVAALFLYRDVVLHPRTITLVYQLDLLQRHGFSLLSHMDRETAQFLRGLNAYFDPEFKLSKKGQGERLRAAVQWVRDYVMEDRIPRLGWPAPEHRVLDVGTNGFVLASSARAIPEVWEDLYRLGHLRGILVSGSEVLLARKSKQVGFALERACPILNELETLAAGTGTWWLDGDYLQSPPGGTSILLTSIVSVALRV